MPARPHKLGFNGVVVIADSLEADSLRPDRRRDLEQTDIHTMDDLLGAIATLGLDSYHYEHPKALAKHAKLHRNDVILSIFGGVASRNRMALVPAICETFGLAYIGPDVYARIICQDKDVSKSVARGVGLIVPSHRIVRTMSDIERIHDFPVPYVVKPLWEGSSIGIGPDNLVTDRIRGEEVIQELLVAFKQPIMVEEFVSGREVSWCFIEGSRTKNLRSLGEVLWGNDPSHFDRNLYDAQHKLTAEGNKIVLNIDSELDNRDAQGMEKLLELIGPLGYGRIDGKLRKGRFVFLEITPDAWLGTTGTFASVFKANGFAFHEIIEQLILSARTNPPNL